MMHQRDFVVPKIMHRFKDWSAHRLDENIMAHSSRFYLFAEDGVFRIAQRVVEGLIHGKDALPAYAGTTQRLRRFELRTIAMKSCALRRQMGAIGILMRWEGLTKRFGKKSGRPWTIFQ